MDSRELKQKGQELAEEMSQLVNYSGGTGIDAFIEKMGRDHRTLQQSFTRLCLQWIEQVAEREGPQHIDARNESSNKTAIRLMKGFAQVIAEEEKISVNEVLSNWDVYKPSKWLSHI